MACNCRKVSEVKAAGAKDLIGDWQLSFEDKKRSLRFFGGGVLHGYEPGSRWAVKDGILTVGQIRLQHNGTEWQGDGYTLKRF